MIDVVALGLISLLGAMSPGPDFAVVTRFALHGSRKSAILTVLGLSSALLIHVTYCILGVGVFLVESPLLFRAVQMGGSLYLGYLGIKLLSSSRDGGTSSTKPHRGAFWAGFFTNLLNPKATLFILSLFTQFVTTETPLSVEIGYGLVIVFVVFGWFLALALLMTHHAILKHLRKFQFYLSKIMGLLLLMLAIYILLHS